jgi:hypothetical protein
MKKRARPKAGAKMKTNAANKKKMTPLNIEVSQASTQAVEQKTEFTSGGRERKEF